MASFSEMDYGVSTSGQKEVYDMIKTEYIEVALDALGQSGETAEYKNFVNALQEGWAGGDRIAFIDNFDKLRLEIIEKIKVYRDSIEKEFALIDQSWEDFQRKNVEIK